MDRLHVVFANYRQRIRVADPLDSSEPVETSILCASYPEESEMRVWVDEEAERRMTV